MEIHNFPKNQKSRWKHILFKKNKNPMEINSSKQLQNNQMEANDSPKNYKHPMEIIN